MDRFNSIIDFCIDFKDHFRDIFRNLDPGWKHVDLLYYVWFMFQPSSF